MKKLTKIILSIFTAITLLGTGAAALQAKPGGWGKGHGGKNPEIRAVRDAVKEDMANARYEVLAQLTGNNVNDLKLEGAVKRFPDLLKQYEVDREAFRAAMDIRSNAIVEQALSSGTITQEQYDAWKLRDARRDLRENFANARYEALAELSGKEVNDLKIQSATQSFRQLLRENNIDRDTFKETVKTKAESVVQQALESGQITQAQADSLKADLAEGKSFWKQGRRGGKHRGGHHRGWNN